MVVVNFLNRKNEADLRVFQLLDEKFQLFTGVFGSSDEVLGAIESGVDFDAISTSLQRISQLVTDFPEIVEMDINPFIVAPPGRISVAADARITLKDAAST